MPPGESSLGPAAERRAVAEAPAGKGMSFQDEMPWGESGLGSGTERRTVAGAPAAQGISFQDEMPCGEHRGGGLSDPLGLDDGPGREEGGEPWVDGLWVDGLWLHPDRELILRRDRRRRRRARNAGLEPLAVLADPVRATIVELLCSGSTTAGDIASAVHDRHGAGWSSVSRHLAVLRASGFALDWHDPPRRFWYLTEDWLDHLRAALASWEGHWQAGAADRELGHVPGLVERGSLPAVGDGPGRARRRSHGRRGRDRSAYGDGRSGNGDDDDGGHGLD